MNLPAIENAWTGLERIAGRRRLRRQPGRLVEAAGVDTVSGEWRRATIFASMSKAQWAKAGSVVRFWHDEPDRDVVYKKHR